MSERGTDVLVYGAGAIGQYLGGRLAAAGLDVHFVARPRIVDALLRDGMRIVEIDGAGEVVPPSRISASAGLADAPAARLVLLTVKSAATRGAAAELAQALPAGTPVISFQNGVDNVARLREAAPTLHAIAGMVPYNVVQPEPGRVQRTTTGHLTVADEPVTRAWQADFARAGLPLDLAADIVAVQWGKLLLNLNNPINAIAGIPLREQLLDRDYRVVLAAMQDEALLALRAAKLAPARVTPVPPSWIPGVLRLPTPLFKLAAKRMLSIHPAARSSMYDDRIAGRPTEIDELCGAVVRLAARHGTSAAVNAKVRDIVERLSPGEFWPGAKLRETLKLR